MMFLLLVELRLPEKAASFFWTRFVSNGTQGTANLIQDLADTTTSRVFHTL